MRQMPAKAPATPNQVYESRVLRYLMRVKTARHPGRGSHAVLLDVRQTTRAFRQQNDSVTLDRPLGDNAVLTLAVLFVVILLLNLMPAFAPPTWMAMSWVGFNVSEGNPLIFAIVAAGAATTGRVILARCARSLVRARWMRQSDRESIDVAKAWLEKHRTLTVSAFFLYALSPLPSNYLFIAYGLSGLPLKVIAVAFFIGRTVTYAVWAHIGRFASAHLDVESELEGTYLSGYFIATQLALLGLVYILMKLDWKMLIEQHRLTFRRSGRRHDTGRQKRVHRHGGER